MHLESRGMDIEPTLNFEPSVKALSTSHIGGDLALGGTKNHLSSHFLIFIH